MFTKIFKKEINPNDLLNEIRLLKNDVCKYKEDHQRYFSLFIDLFNFFQKQKSIYHRKNGRKN